MKTILSDEEAERIILLGEMISNGLGCHVNGPLQCGSCRLTGVKLMKEYLEIHSYEVKLVKAADADSV